MRIDLRQLKRLSTFVFDQMGQREKNKIEKLFRIKEAARDLFLSKGFDDTTTREIASRAGVGIGTVFIYADDKRDLLFLVANDELEETKNNAEAGVHDDASCLRNLLTVFRYHYDFFGRQPDLSRLMLREMTFYHSGRQSDRFQATLERVIRLVGDIMGQTLERGMIRSVERSEFVGWAAFCIFQVELRRWLMTKDIEIELVALQRALKLFMQGLAPDKRALLVADISKKKE